MCFCFFCLGCIIFEMMKLNKGCSSICFRVYYSHALISIYTLYWYFSRFLRYFVHAPFIECLHYQPGQGILSLSILLKISVKACGKYSFMHDLIISTNLQQIFKKNNILPKRSKLINAYMVVWCWKNMSSAVWIIYKCHGHLMYFSKIW